MRLETMQRDFLWGRGALTHKPHLVNWFAFAAWKNKKGVWASEIYLSLIKHWENGSRDV